MTQASAQHVLPHGARALIACGAALLAACESSSIAPSYPGTLLLVANDASGELLEVEPNGGNVRERYAVVAPVVAIATASNGQYAATIDPHGAVVVVDLARQLNDGAWRLQTSGTVTGLVFADRRSTLAASCAGSGDVLLVGRESGRIEARVGTGCASVVALARSTDGDALLAGCDGPPSIVRIDVARRAVVERVALATAPTSIAAGFVDHGTNPFLPGDKFDLEWPPYAVASDFEGQVVVASCRHDGQLVIVRNMGLEPDRVAIAAPDLAPTPWAVAVDPDGKVAFVSIVGEGRVVVVDLHANRVRGEYAVGGRPGALAWTVMRAPPEFGVDSGGK